jgi:hypothetical protein
MSADGNGAELRACVAEKEYASPNLEPIDLRHAFPKRIIGDAEASSWPYLRRLPGQLWHVDRRNPTVGFTSLDEAMLLYNSARLFANRPCLEIGCWRAWSTAHIAAGSGSLDVVDPILADPAFLADVRNSLAAAGVLDRVQLCPGSSPEKVESLAAQGAKRWSFIFIDGNHEGDAPRIDAEVVARHAAPTAMIVLHDLLSPDVAAGLNYFRSNGWQVGLYYTMQMVGIAWRGQVTPLPHLPDPRLPVELPSHLAGYPILSDASSLRPSENIKAPSTVSGDTFHGVGASVSAAEFDRLCKRLIDINRQISVMHLAATQNNASLAAAKEVLEEEKRLRLQAEKQIEEIAADRNNISALYLAAERHLSSFATTEKALAEEKRLRLRAEQQLEEAVAEKANISDLLQRLSAKHAELVGRLTPPNAVHQPTGPAADLAQLIAVAQSLGRTRLLFGLMRRRFTEDPVASRERLAQILTGFGLHGAHRQTMIGWLMSRRVLIGLLRRSLPANGAAARLAVLLHLLYTNTAIAAPESARDIATATLGAYETARLRALEAAKLADEEEILRLRLMLLSFEGETAMQSAAAA